MAIASSSRRRKSYDDRIWDPLLAKVATENRFDCDWDELRRHFKFSIQAAQPCFQARPRTPPRRYAPSSPANAASSDAPPSESLLLSPSHPTTPLDQPPRPNASTSPTESQSQSDSGLRPSTPGGLIIPPFPPLDRNRRRRSSTPSQIERPPAPAPGPPRPNGAAHPGPPVRPGGNVFEDEWDEDVVIGGKMLPGDLENEEGRREIRRLQAILDGMDEPPFTIQRLSELLLRPTSMHSTLGKFYRAVEKCLLVTSPWEPPSYTYTPGMQLPTRPLYPASSSSSASDDGTDPESTIPPGSTTPMFSPIPFLRSDSIDDIAASMPMSGNGTNPHLDGGLMSPLTLGGESPNMSSGFQFTQAPSVRSPTPEPEEGEEQDGSTSSGGGALEKNKGGNGDVEMSAVEEDGSPAQTISTPTPSQISSDPGHQPYLGRVDELDTGPIASSDATPSTPSANGHDQRDEDMSTPGTGEAGTMTPHGMSERPVPISSTTVVEPLEDRRVAGLPTRVGEKVQDGPGLEERFVSSGEVEANNPPQTAE